MNRSPFQHLLRCFRCRGQRRRPHGRNGGGNIQIVTKSGTNDFHGGVYHYLQNEKLNANEFFLNRGSLERPDFRRNETGATFGGPAWQNRTFFFGALQRTDFASGYAANAQAQAGLPTGLTDVRTRESIAAVANEWLRTGAEDHPDFTRNLLTALRRFPAEQIPGLTAKFFTDADRLQLRTLTPQDIHPVAVNILNTQRNGQFLIPTPDPAWQTLPGNGTYGREFLKQDVVPTIFNAWTGSGSVEHHVSEKNRLRLHYIRSTQLVEEAFGWADASPSPTLADNASWTASLSDHHTISPNWLNELRGGFFELYNTRISKYRDITNSSLGIYNPIEAAIGGLASLVPTININTQRNSGGIGNAWDFFDRQRVINIADIATYTSGKQTVQFGGEWRRPTIKGEFMSRTNGDLDYNSWAFFFTGHGAASGSSDLDQGDTGRHFKMHDYGLFVQDDWRVAPRLTLNLGLRYDFYGNPSEADGKIGNYYPQGVASRLGVQPGFHVPANSVIFQPDFHPLQLGLVVDPSVNVDLSRVHRAMNDSTLTSDYNNFAPRIGFAWQPGGWQSVVLRGGYGIFYERASAAFKTDLQRTAPFFIYQNVPAPPDMADPYPRLNINPFQLPLNVDIVRDANGTPRWMRGDGTPFPAQSPFNAKNYTFIDPFIRTPYVQQWTFNVQFEPLPGNLVDLRYVGSRGVGLLAKLNAAQPRDPREFPVNGFTDIVDGRGNAINPDFFVQPEFLGLNRNGGFQVRSNWGHSNYHAFQMGLRRRYQNGLQWNIAYTWSKTLDNVSSDTELVEHNAFDLANNRGLSEFDRTHRFTASYLAEIPAFFRSSSFGGALLNGWSIGGMVTVQSGAPFTVLATAPRMQRLRSLPVRDWTSLPE